jgi:hypothetical protein
MSDWIYNGEAFLEPGDNYGFVYIITNKIDNRQYIGKKFFWSIRRKQVKKVRRRVTTESDWKTYWSSSDELQSDVQRLGVENFTREIIHLCPNKGTANYLEAKEQFTRSVLENKDLWYNSWISVKVMRSHVRLS